MFLSIYYFDVKMGMARSGYVAHTGRRNSQVISVEDMNGRYHLGYTNVGGLSVFRWVFKSISNEVKTEFHWPRVVAGSSGYGK